MYQQHLLRTQKIFCSLIHSLIIPFAQPTPASTKRAVEGQFLAQAPHSMQASKQVIIAFPSSNENTWCGQTSKHLPQPIHLFVSSLSVDTLLR